MNGAKFRHLQTTPSDQPIEFGDNVTTYPYRTLELSIRARENRHTTISHGGATILSKMGM